MANNKGNADMPQKEIYRLMLGQLDRIEKKVDKGFDKINGRVRKLENWRSALLGAWGLVVLVVTIIWGVSK